MAPISTDINLGIVISVVGKHLTIMFHLVKLPGKWPSRRMNAPGKSDCSASALRGNKKQPVSLDNLLKQ